MFYYVDSQITKTDLKKMFKVGYEGKDFVEKEFLDGYSHSFVAAILNENPAIRCQ